MVISLGACSGGKIRTVQAEIAPADLEIPLCDCRPYPRPSPIDIDIIEPVNIGAEGWLLDNESYLNNAAFWQQVKRYIQETNDALNYWFECVAQCNIQYQKLNEQ